MDKLFDSFPQNRRHRNSLLFRYNLNLLIGLIRQFDLCLAHIEEVTEIAGPLQVSLTDSTSKELSLWGSLGLTALDADRPIFLDELFQFGFGGCMLRIGGEVV